MFSLNAPSVPTVNGNAKVIVLSGWDLDDIQDATMSLTFSNVKFLQNFDLSGWFFRMMWSETMWRLIYCSWAGWWLCRKSVTEIKLKRGIGNCSWPQIAIFFSENKTLHFLLFWTHMEHWWPCPSSHPLHWSKGGDTCHRQIDLNEKFHWFQWGWNSVRQKEKNNNLEKQWIYLQEFFNHGLRLIKCQTTPDYLWKHKNQSRWNGQWLGPCSSTSSFRHFRCKCLSLKTHIKTSGGQPDGSNLSEKIRNFVSELTVQLINVSVTKEKLTTRNLEVEALFGRSEGGRLPVALKLKWMHF